MENEANGASASNPKLDVVRSKNQIDFFMHNYTVYKKSGVVVMDVMIPDDKGEDLHSYYELTKEEFESDDFRVLADTIRKNPQQFADRRLL
ncbi:MAG: hypothetical protein IKZ99_09735 [Salinivirgaceae bacterium]|nr:hypothetical protein [Salinivirgaceae bacterium]